MNVSPQTKPKYKCSPLRPFHSTLVVTVVTYKNLLLPAWSDLQTRRPSCVPLWSVHKFLSLNFQVIQANLNLIYNKSRFGWQGIASSLSFPATHGAEVKENPQSERRDKCRDFFWIAERAGSILGITQWEICLWDPGEKQKLCAINQNRSFTLFLNTVYLKAALGWKHMQSLETNHRNKNKKKNRSLPTHPCSNIPQWDTPCLRAVVRRLSKRTLVGIRTLAMQIQLWVKIQTYWVEFQSEAVGGLRSWLPWFPGWLGPAAFSLVRDACKDSCIGLSSDDLAISYFGRHIVQWFTMPSIHQREYSEAFMREQWLKVSLKFS